MRTPTRRRRLLLGQKTLVLRQQRVGVAERIIDSSQSRCLQGKDSSRARTARDRVVVGGATTKRIPRARKHAYSTVRQYW